MRIINSIKARIQGKINDRRSGWKDYVKFYKDGILFDKCVFFESFGGKNFQGNPYYMFKELFFRKECQDFQIVIAHNNPTDLKNYLSQKGLYDDRIKIVKPLTTEYREFLCHAKYLVNNVGFSSDFIKKPEQVYLNTWHGTPLKYLGRRVEGDPIGSSNPQRNLLMSNVAIAPNEFTKSVYENDFMLKDIMGGELLVAGYPRNSIFFDHEHIRKVKRDYHIEDVKTVLYMPTWRDNFTETQQADQVEDIESLAKELGEGYKVYVKFHPAMNCVPSEFKYCHKPPNDLEVYEFLSAVDILITDYSSVFFDFASTNKKIVLYQYDKEEYCKDRGMYKSVQEELPFETVYAREQLLNAIRDCEKPEYGEFISKYCPKDNVDSAKNAVDLLISNKQINQKDAVDFYVINFAFSEGDILELKSKLENKRYQFVFILGKHTKGKQNCPFWKEINFRAIQTYERITLKEKIKIFFLRVYKMFNRKHALLKLDEYAERERRRLWGELNIGRVFAKGKNLPISLKYKREPFNNGL